MRIPITAADYIWCQDEVTLGSRWKSQSSLATTLRTFETLSPSRLSTYNKQNYKAEPFQWVNHKTGYICMVPLVEVVCFIYIFYGAVFTSIRVLESSCELHLHELLFIALSIQHSEYLALGVSSTQIGGSSTHIGASSTHIGASSSQSIKHPEHQ